MWDKTSNSFKYYDIKSNILFFSDPSTPSESSDEMAQSRGARSAEEQPLMKKGASENGKNEAGYTSHDDTICSNRSAYFKQY